MQSIGEPARVLVYLCSTTYLFLYCINLGYNLYSILYLSLLPSSYWMIQDFFFLTCKMHVNLYHPMKNKNIGGQGTHSPKNTIYTKGKGIN